MRTDKDPSNTPSIRSFLAAPVTEALATALLESVEASRQVLPPLRVTARENLHLTLVFLGNLTAQELDNTVIPRVTAVVEQASPGRIYFRQVAGFPSREKPRHLVLEGHGSPSAETLQGALARALEDILGNRERKQWRPHITLGRFREPPADALTPTPWQAELPVGEVCLYESQTTIHGPVYRVRKRWRLGQPPA